jgi:hypothetical protein
MPCISTKRNCEQKKVSLGKVRRAVAHQADHIGAGIVRHRIPAKIGTANQSIAGENQYEEGKKKHVRSISAPLSDEEENFI